MSINVPLLTDAEMIRREMKIGKIYFWWCQQFIDSLLSTYFREWRADVCCEEWLLKVAISDETLKSRREMVLKSRRTNELLRNVTFLWLFWPIILLASVCVCTSGRSEILEDVILSVSLKDKDQKIEGETKRRSGSKNQEMDVQLELFTIFQVLYLSVAWNKEVNGKRFFSLIL